MPISPPIACKCGGRRTAGVCDRCGPRKLVQHKAKTSERGYGYDWQLFREMFLSDNPLCEDCKPVISAATEVHHKCKIKHQPELRLEPSNCLALCDSCHNKRTAKGE